MLISCWLGGCWLKFVQSSMFNVNLNEINEIDETDEMNDSMTQ